MIKKLIQFLPALLIICVTGALSYYWLMNKPRATRIKPKPVIPLVETIQAVLKDHQTTIHALGNVFPAQSVNLTSRINGMIIDVSPNFIEGGMLKKGEEIVRLERTDYLLQIRQRESELAKAQFDLKMELGQQAISKREFQLLGAELDEDEQELVLRRPHLNAAKAALAASEASLQQARLDLQRTSTVAPFNAIIIERNANLGSWVSTFSTGTPLVKLVGTDYFWIDVSLPVNKLRWINVPGINNAQGSAVRISYKAGWGQGIYRHGFVKRLQAEIEPEGRMAKIIVEVKDPLSRQMPKKPEPPLMLGSFVRVEITGKILNDVFSLPESTLRDGNALWLISEQNTLDIRQVNPLWHEQGLIFLDKHQIPENSHIINSDLAAPIQGMRIQHNIQDPVVNE